MNPRAIFSVGDIVRVKNEPRRVDAPKGVITYGRLLKVVRVHPTRNGGETYVTISDENGWVWYARWHQVEVVYTV